MTKYEESKELLKQEIIARRLPLDVHYLRDKDDSFLMLAHYLEWDYLAVRCQIVWKILFLKRKLERIKLKALPEDVSSLTEQRLKSDLAKAQNILDLIYERLEYLQTLQSEIFDNYNDSIKKNKIASEEDLSQDDMDEWMEAAEFIDQDARMITRKKKPNLTLTKKYK